jgi:hypothetical protein
MWALRAGDGGGGAPAAVAAAQGVHGACRAAATGGKGYISRQRKRPRPHHFCGNLAEANAPSVAIPRSIRAFPGMAAADPEAAVIAPTDGEHVAWYKADPLLQRPVQQLDALAWPPQFDPRHEAARRPRHLGAFGKVLSIARVMCAMLC